MLSINDQNLAKVAIARSPSHSDQPAFQRRPTYFKTATQLVRVMLAIEQWHQRRWICQRLRHQHRRRRRGSSIRLRLDGWRRRRAGEPGAHVLQTRLGWSCQRLCDLEQRCGRGRRMSSRLTHTHRLWTRRYHPQAERTEGCFGRARRRRDGTVCRVSAHGRKGWHCFGRAAPWTYGCWVRDDGQAASAPAAYGGWRESWWLGFDGLLDFVSEEYWPEMNAAEESLCQV
jgi:hypothetical protein